MKFGSRVLGLSLLTSIACTVLSACIMAPSHAQGEPEKSIADVLKKAVRFDAPACTIEDVTKSLSEQTGLKIEAESCLRERRVLVQCTDTPASDLLTSLADLHDWTWEETVAHSILLRRKTARLARSEPELAALIHSAMPKDLRNYIGFGVNPAALPLPSDAEQRRLVQSSGNLPGSGPAGLVGARLMALDRAAQLRLVGDLPPDVRTGTRQPWPKIAPLVKSSLLLTMVLNTLHNAYMGSSGAEAILSGRLSGFMVDPSRVIIKLNVDGRGNKEILIGSDELLGDNRRAFVGFGGGVTD
jgi:hypothetical protein